MRTLNRIRFKHRLVLQASVAVLSVLLLPVSDAAAQIDEIITTARKREQTLQDVPLSVLAIDAEDIARQNIKSFDDYVAKLTSVSYGSASPGATTIAFRGAVSQPSGIDTISSSIMYLDEIPITRDGQNPDVKIIDIAQIEALAGPQPTIYGAGSQSGTLRIITNKPDLNAGFEGYVEAGAGLTHEGDESYSLQGAVNLPVIEDRLAVRLVGFYDKEGGYIDNVLGTTSIFSEDSGTRDNAALVEEDINSSESYGGRVAATLEVNPNWAVTVGAIYQNTTLDSFYDSNPELDDLQTVKFKDEFREDDWYNLALTIEGDLGFANLTATAGYHSRDINYDIDGTAYATTFRDTYLDQTGPCPDVSYYDGIDQCYYNIYGYGDDPTATMSLRQEIRSFVQEVRLTSKDNTGSRFSWLLGAFYEHTDNNWDYLMSVDDLPTAPLSSSFFTYYGLAPTTAWFDQGFFSDDFGYEADIEQYAVFGELAVDITDSLTLTGGGRFFEAEYGVAERTQFPAGRIEDEFEGSQKTNGFSPRVNLSYEFAENAMVYYTYSEGTRIGGRNGGLRPNAVSPRNYEPDKLINNEIGLKSKWSQGRVLFNASVYDMDWKDFQLQTNDPVSGQTVVLNIGQASIFGVEAALAFKPNDALELSGALTYTDAKTGAESISGGVVIVGENERLPVTPKIKATASVQYGFNVPFDGFEGYGRFDVSHVGSSVNAIQGALANFGAGTSTVQNQPAYQTGNVSIGLESEAYDLSFWVGNVWDERGVTYINPVHADNRVLTTRPREVWFTARRRF